MADKITTLHPKGDLNTNVYPNVKWDNLDEQTKQTINDKVSQGDFDDVVRGVTPVGKATADASGNNIVNTYATKTALETLRSTVSSLNNAINDEEDNREYADEQLQSQIDDNSNDISNLQGRMATSENVVANIINGTQVVGKATADASGNNIVNIYATKIELETVQTDLEQADNDIRNTLDDVEDDISDIKDGTQVVGKAHEDGNGNNIVNTYATKTALSNHTSNTSNPHNVTKAQVGLGNVDNTSDINKPISNATQLALDIINSKIPSQASSSNQLADKAFVNSSISTATATFKGTYTSTSLLPTTDVDENDYAFVVTTDSSGNTVYNRYKYSSGSWLFEYALNNSSFTAEQWSAINSGITASIVNTLVSDVSYLRSTVSSLNNAINDEEDNREDADENLQSQIDDNSNDISNLQGRMATSESVVANIINGTQVVGKATADASGNNIVNTYATKTALSNHTSNTNNPHNVTASQIGLGSATISTITRVLDGDNNSKIVVIQFGKIVVVTGNIYASTSHQAGTIITSSLPSSSTRVWGLMCPNNQTQPNVPLYIENGQLVVDSGTVQAPYWYNFNITYSI